MKRIKNCLVFLLLLAFLAGAQSAFAQTAAPIRIAFIDSGISTKHIDASKVAQGRNYVFPESDTEDRIGHGTATAGLVLGAADLDVAGIYPDAVAVPLVVVDVYPSGAAKNGGPEALCQAIYDAVDYFDCRIINISLCTTEDSDDLRAATEYAESKGILLIAAVGNDGEDGGIYYPAAYETVVSVGAAEGKDAAAFSQDGADLLAGDGELYTATNKNGKRPAAVVGTSYSCALVTGVCARLLERYPELTPERARNALFALAEDILAPGYDARSGWGLLSVEAEIPYPDWEIPAFPKIPERWPEKPRPEPLQRWEKPGAQRWKPTPISGYERMTK